MPSFNFRKILSIIIFVLIIVFIVYYVKSHWQDFQSIKIVSWWYFSGLVILTPVSFWITSWFFQKSLEPYSLKLLFNQYFGLTMITLMGNYLIPFSGLGVRAVYMKRVYNFSYRNFLTTIIANWITNFLIYSLAGLVAVLIYYFKAHTINWTITIIFLAVTLASLATFIPLLKIISPVREWQEYLKHQGILNQLLVITFWQFIVTALMFYLAYLTFGFKISFFGSFWPTTLSLYSSVIRLVPGSLGFYELAVAYPSKVMGLSIAQGLSVSALTRLVTIFWTFALGPFFSYILLKKSRPNQSG